MGYNRALVTVCHSAFPHNAATTTAPLLPAILHTHTHKPEARNMAYTRLYSIITQRTVIFVKNIIFWDMAVNMRV
jgi:hypothetical protein